MSVLTDAATERQILRRCSNGGIAEEEGRCDYCTNAHGITTPQMLVLDHTSSNKGTEDGTNVGDGVITPCLTERRRITRNSGTDQGPVKCNTELVHISAIESVMQDSRKIEKEQGIS